MSMRRRLLLSLCCVAAIGGSVAAIAAIAASAARPSAAGRGDCSIAAGAPCVHGCTIPVAAAPANAEHAKAVPCRSVPPVRPCVQPAVLVTRPQHAGEAQQCAATPLVLAYPHRVTPPRRVRPAHRATLPRGRRR